MKEVRALIPNQIQKFTVGEHCINKTVPQRPVVTLKTTWRSYSKT